VSELPTNYASIDQAQAGQRDDPWGIQRFAPQPCGWFAFFQLDKVLQYQT